MNKKGNASILYSLGRHLIVEPRVGGVCAQC